jgi:hypothetical protein
MKRFLFFATMLVTLAVQAGEHKYQSMIYGPTSVYITTNGYSLAWDSAWATNVVSTAPDGTTTFAPYATNSVTGGVYPSWSKPVLWTDIFSTAVGTNVTRCFSVTMKYVGTAPTNTVTFKVGKSVDGTNWDTNTTVSAYIMTNAPSGYTTYCTNVADPWVYAGAKYIRLLQITVGTNASVSASAIVVKDFGVGGYAP